MPDPRPDDPVELELFLNRFTAIAEAMGEALRRTALSTNVKERLDFSCALLDRGGRLVVSAPHIPVHLGALGLCVRELRRILPLGPGDVAVSNHPAYGGSHLPDVTVVTPVFSGSAAGEPRLVGYAASRAHHAEIGGTRPGSMPPAARCLAEEGVVLAPQYLVRGGRPRWDEIERGLSAPPYPSRAVRENLADLRAALAANRRGARALASLAREHGDATVTSFLGAVTTLAESKMRRALDRFPDGRYSARETLDDGAPIEVAIEVRGERATIDFAGTSGVHPGNLNAPPAVARSAVLYVLRLLIGEDLPLNEGLLAPIDLRIPPGLLDPPFDEDPRRSPAVVGGNVETSQRVVDALMRALGLAAGSQGTMNNLLFGSDAFGYYETLCGGCGAGPGFDGADAVHSHMTNTAITDPEILEHRYPVRLERFEIRRGSGGRGRHRGGDGVVREIRFLAPVALSVLSQHREEGPYALEGGERGRPGAQRVLRADGREEALGGIDHRDLDVDDRVVVETPGGGGWGRPEP